MKKISTQALLLFGSDAGARFLGFLATVQLARVLDPLHFGYITIGMSVLSYAQWFADLGLSTLGAREFALPFSQRSFRLGNILLLRLLLAGAVLGVTGLLITLLYTNSLSFSISQLYLISVLPFAFMLEWYFQGIRTFVPVMLSRIAGGVIYTGGIYLFLLRREDILIAPLLYLASTIVSSIILLAAKNKEDTLLPSSLPIQAYTTIMRHALVISTGGFFAMVVQMLPPLVIGILLSSREAGIFGAAMKLMVLALAADRVFVTLLLPVLAHRWNTNKEGMNHLLSQLLRLAITGGCTISLTFSIFAAPLILFIFKKPFQESITVLSLLSWFIAATIINSVFCYALIATGHERSYLASTVKSGSIAGIIIVGATWVGGLIGTACGVVLAELLIMSMMFLEFRRFFQVRWFRTLSITASAAGAFTFLASLIPAEYYWLRLIIVPAFIGTLMLLQVLHPQNILTVLRT